LRRLHQRPPEQLPVRKNVDELVRSRTQAAKKTSWNHVYHV